LPHQQRFNNKDSAAKAEKPPPMWSSSDFDVHSWPVPDHRGSRWSSLIHSS
jgi:hypothetical protein